jgi:hypothetical protein
MKDNLKSHITELEKFNKERIFWMRLSGFVAISILLIVLDWTLLGQHSIHWVLISVGLVLAVTWWYWTMKMVRTVIDHRVIEVEILSDIVVDIKEIREDVKKIRSKDLTG